MRFFKYSEHPGDGAETEQNISKKEKRVFSSFFAKIVCIVAAIMVWFYASGEQSTTYEKEFQGVQIKYDMGTLDEKGYTIINGKNTTVNVVVSGTRREVNNLSSDDIMARADLSEISSSGEYPVKVNVTLPGDTNVKSIYPSELRLYIDIPTQKSFKVDVDTHNIAMSDSTLKIRKFNLSVDEVWVTGPEEEVSKIGGAKIDIDFSGEKLANTVTRSDVTIKLVDTDGKIYSNPYVELDETETNVEVVVQKTVTVPIKPKYSGKFVPGEAGYSETVEPKEITIRGTPEVINSISYVETSEIPSFEITEKIYENDATITLPAGVEIEGNSEKTVKIVLERKNITKSIKTSNILLLNCSDELDYQVEEEEIMIVFSGNYDDVEKLSEKNIYLVGDMTGRTKEGLYENIRLRVMCYGLDVLDNGSVNVDEKYTCTVRAKKKTDNLPAKDI